MRAYGLGRSEEIEISENYITQIWALGVSFPPNVPNVDTASKQFLMFGICHVRSV